MTIYLLIETEKNMFLASHFQQKEKKKKINPPQIPRVAFSIFHS